MISTVTGRHFFHWIYCRSRHTMMQLAGVLTTTSTGVISAGSAVKPMIVSNTRVFANPHKPFTNADAAVATIHQIIRIFHPFFYFFTVSFAAMQPFLDGISTVLSSSQRKAKELAYTR